MKKSHKRKGVVQPRLPADVRRSAESRRGAVLLVVMGILALLSVFAVSFASLVSLEKSASRNYIDSVRARFVARAGLQRAIAELREAARRRPYDDPRPLSSSNPNRGEPWVYQQRYQTTYRGLDDANLISFRKQDPGYVVETVTGTGTSTQPLVYSGMMGKTYGNRAMDSYRLKILDCASMINVNNKDEAALERMLTSLLRAHIDRADSEGYTAGINDSQAVTIAQRVRQRRPGGGFKTKAELGILMRDFTGGPNISDDMWLRLRDDLTCFGWQDSKVILPPRTVTTGSSSSSTTTGSGSGSSGLDLTSRAPVNMNTASKEVLTACFAGLEGRIERFRRTFNGTTAALANRSGFPVTLSISFNQAANLAQKIIVRRSSGSGGSSTTGEVGEGPFKSWFEFETWLDHHSNWANARRRDLVKAMANPNTDLCYNKFAAEGNHIYRWRQAGNAYIPTVPRELDKSDLTAITTELCFSSMGFFEITSLGQIWNGGQPDGGQTRLRSDEIVASQSIQSVVQVFNVFRLTTQRDFERDREYRDKKLFLPYTKGSTGAVKGFTSLAAKEGAWPATLTQPEYSNNHVLPVAGSGVTLGESNFTLSQEYNPADYDGQIILNGLARIFPTDQEDPRRLRPRLAAAAQDPLLRSRHRSLERRLGLPERVRPDHRVGRGAQHLDGGQDDQRPARRGALAAQPGLDRQRPVPRLRPDQHRRADHRGARPLYRLRRQQPRPPAGHDSLLGQAGRRSDPEPEAGLLLLDRRSP